MSVYVENPGDQIKSIGVVGQYLMIDRLGNLCDGTPGLTPYGVTMNLATAAGQSVPVRFLCAGSYKATAAGVIGVGQRVYTAAAGQVSKQATGVYLGRAHTAATAAGDVITIEPPTFATTILAEALATSTVITSTAAETVFSNASFTLPANELQPGDNLIISCQGFLVARNATDTQTIKLYFGSTVIASIATAALTTGDFFSLTFDLTVTADGATGSLRGYGDVETSIAGTLARGFQRLAPTAVDTTSAVANLIKVSAQCSAANAGDQIQLEAFQVFRVNAN